MKCSGPRKLATRLLASMASPCLRPARVFRPLRLDGPLMAAVVLAVFFSPSTFVLIHVAFIAAAILRHFARVSWSSFGVLFMHCYQSLSTCPRHAVVSVNYEEVGRIKGSIGDEEGPRTGEVRWWPDRGRNEWVGFRTVVRERLWYVLPCKLLSVLWGINICVKWQMLRFSENSDKTFIF